MDDLEAITETVRNSLEEYAERLPFSGTLALRAFDSLLSELRRVKEELAAQIKGHEAAILELTRLREKNERLREFNKAKGRVIEGYERNVPRLREIERVTRDVIERLPKQYGDLGEAIKELRNALQPQTEKESR